MSYTYRMVLKSRLTDNSEFRNVFDFESNSLWTTELQGAVDQWIGAMYPSTYLAWIRSDLTFYEYEIWKWDTGGWTPVATNSVNKVGTAAGQPLPRQAAAVTLAKTQLRRSFGRKFHPGMIEAYGTDGMLDTALIAVLTEYAVKWIGQRVNSGAWLYPGISREQEGARVIYRFVSAVVNGIMGSQRRRKQGVGI